MFWADATAIPANNAAVLSNSLLLFIDASFHRRRDCLRPCRRLSSTYLGNMGKSRSVPELRSILCEPSALNVPREISSMIDLASLENLLSGQPEFHRAVAMQLADAMNNGSEGTIRACRTREHFARA